MRESDAICSSFSSSPTILSYHILISLLCLAPVLYYTLLVDVKKDKNGSDDGSDDPPASPVKPVKGATKQTWGSKPKGR